MKYYKIIANNAFVGVVHSGNFVKENPKSHRLLISDEIHGQYIDYFGVLYRDYWMVATLSDTTRQHINANIEEITEEEYTTLLEAIHNNEEIIIEDDDDDGEDIIIEPDIEPDITVEFMRTSKLNEMSHTCRHTIESGFDLELRGETHHFSLTTQDQLNLMSLSAFAQTQELIPYHADGEECEFYTPEEINQIITAATEFKNYQIAYFNSLKVYINTLDTIETIAAITYGTPIPDEYKSDVLRVLE